MEKREKTKYRLTEEQVAEVNHRLAAFREGGRYATDEQVAALWEREVGVTRIVWPQPPCAQKIQAIYRGENLQNTI
jgi:hypothetical protein